MKILSSLLVLGALVFSTPGFAEENPIPEALQNSLKELRPIVQDRIASEYARMRASVGIPTEHMGSERVGRVKSLEKQLTLPAVLAVAASLRGKILEFDTDLRYLMLK